MTTAPGTAAEPVASIDNAGKGAVPSVKRARGEFLFFVLRSKKFLIAAAILVFLAFLAIFGPMINSTDPIVPERAATESPEPRNRQLVRYHDLR